VRPNFKRLTTKSNEARRIAVITTEALARSWPKFILRMSQPTGSPPVLERRLIAKAAGAGGLTTCGYFQRAKLTHYNVLS
jgi:hypothetical protein